MQPDEGRSAVLREAETWLLTPWHHRAHVKGAGVDCGLFVVSVFIAAGLLGWDDLLPAGARLPEYPGDWMLHRSEERFLAGMRLFADPIAGPPQPADIAAWKYGRCYSHAAIVVAWPRVIHAYLPERRVCWGDASRGQLAERPVRFFSRFERLARAAA